MQDLANLARKILARFVYFLQDGFYWIVKGQGKIILLVKSQSKYLVGKHFDWWRRSEYRIYRNAIPLICVLPCVFHTVIIITCPSLCQCGLWCHCYAYCEVEILKFGISHISLCHFNCPIYPILVVSSTQFYPLGFIHSLLLTMVSYILVIWNIIIMIYTQLTVAMKAAM